MKDSAAFFLSFFLTLLILGCTAEYTSVDPRVDQNGNFVAQKLGERLPNCQQQEDWEKIELSAIEAAKIMDGLAAGNNTVITLPGSNCLRIGSTFSLVETNAIKGLLATLMPTKISYDKITDRSTVDVEVIEKFASMALSNEGDRIPNCPERYYDWDKFYIEKATAENFTAKLKDGSKTADIWNGVYNCFRVGKTAEVIINEDKKVIGEIKVMETRVLHISELTPEIASLTGKNYEEVKKDLEKYIETDGGYLSLILFTFKFIEPAEPTDPVEPTT